MVELSLTLLLLSMFLGFLLGIVSGLTPGIHVNNFALLLVGASSVLAGFGLGPFYIAVIILSNSIAHTFFDIIPSVFLGAPEPETALAVLPGHRLLLEGRGSEAVRLAALGSAGSIIVSLLLVFPLALFFGYVYGIVDDYMGWILLGIVVVMIATERGEMVVGQGSLVPLKYKAYAILLFLISGFLGIFAFQKEDLMSPIISLGETSILLPLLSGLFGASMIVISLFEHSEIPPQVKTRRFDLSRHRILRGIFTGSMAGSLVAWLPGVSSAVATVIARLFVSDFRRGDNGPSKEFLVSLNGANTANAVFGLVALFVIERARSGAMVAIQSLGINLDLGVLVMLFLVILSVSIVSYYMTILIGDLASSSLAKINYHKLSSCVLSGLAFLVFLFTGWFGLLVFIISIPIGMFASYAKIRKAHAMGVILLPVILFFFGFR